MSSQRIDQRLVELGFYESRNRARAGILKGDVYVNGIKVIKSSQKFEEDDDISVKQPEKYVSRGAYKLLTAQREFSLDFAGKRALDIGASTGGFTDVMLQNEIDKVVTVDSGTNQLHYSIRKNSRVTVFEKTNFRYFDHEEYYGYFDIAVADLSFISIDKIYENARKYVAENGIMVFLIKPQFEAGKDQVGKGGVVRDVSIHREILRKYRDLVLSYGDSMRDLCASDIKGNRKGNQEYLVYIVKNTVLSPVKDETIWSVTENAR